MSRHGLEIRAAASADGAALAELLADAGCPVPAPTLSARLAGLRQSAGTALLALEWGPPSGIIVLHWHPTLDADLLTAQVSALLVAPAARRRGIGRLLVKAAAQTARTAGCGSITLPVAAQQPELHAFCQATGFTQDAQRFTRALRRHLTSAQPV